MNDKTFNRWQSHRIFLQTSFIIVALFTFRFAASDLVSEEWMIKGALYAALIFALGEGLEKGIDSWRAMNESTSRKSERDST